MKCLLLTLAACSLALGECAEWMAKQPAWIFCDDFDGATPKVGTGSYFEYDDNGGDFVPAAGVGLNGTTGMRVKWQQGGTEAGNLKLGFGRNPVEYMSKGIRDKEDFREIWYRMYLRMQPGWTGLNPAKLSRATVFAKPDWSQAMIAHLWSDDNGHLLLDPARCVDANNNVTCSGYNDFNHLEWIGNKAGSTQLFASSNAGIWYCVEAHVKLNDPGKANGVSEFWLNNVLEARREGLDFVGRYTSYGINGVFFENYWNAGSPKVQERYFDNLVVSTAPIGCDAGGTNRILRPYRRSMPFMDREFDAIGRRREATLKGRQLFPGDR